MSKPKERFQTCRKVGLFHCMVFESTRGSETEQECIGEQLTGTADQGRIFKGEYCRNIEGGHVQTKIIGYQGALQDRSSRSKFCTVSSLEPCTNTRLWGGFYFWIQFTETEDLCIPAQPMAVQMHI
jgi:hypothetical protein